MIRQTNTVQNFIRSLAFLVTLIILGGLTLIPLAILSVDSGFFVTLLFITLVIDLWLAGVFSKMFYILPEWEKLVLLRLGKYVGTKGPGFFMVPPFLYSVASILDTRITTQQVEATATLTQDNVPTKVTAALEFEIEDAQKAVINVKNYLSSVIWLSTEALKNTIGSLDLKELLSNRDEIARQLKHQIDQEAAVYGINVRAVRITDIDTPTTLVEELAVIARARRSAQAKQIEAEAEVMVAEKMAEATKILSSEAGSFKLRELQNLSEMSKEESSMIIIYPYGEETAREVSSAAINLANKKETSKTRSANKVSNF